MRLHRKVALGGTVWLLFASCLFAAIPQGYAGVVFDSLKGVPMQIPGFVTAAYFDKGDSAVTFQYTWSNMGDCHWRDGDPGKKVSLQYFGTWNDFVAGTVGGIVDSAAYPPHANCHIGWVQSGEWLKYTVHVNTAGKYKMILHHSVVDTSNLILFNVGDLPTDSVGGLPICIRPPGDVEINHDWRWDTTKTRLTLDTGLFLIKVSFFHEGLNFHGMEFMLDNTPVQPEKNQALAQKGFGIVPIVKGDKLSVSFSLDQTGLVAVSLFDCAGRAAAPAIVKTLNAGRQKQDMGLGGLLRGLYFVRVEQNGLREVKSIPVAR
ncbi:MAG TPA: hypothetical protein VLX68_11180 [Chitinivibrionales bacterium]|nr:hypothetical protein [Chitinivibrionales bacterium]